MPKWYKNGIRFECQGCGNCCKSLDDGDGYVYLNDDEIEGIANYLKIDKKKFINAYTEIKNGYRVIRDPDKDCIFLKNNKCLIYTVRPAQCKTWPFWEIALIKKNWDEKVVTTCPGVGKGRLYTIEEIEDISKNKSPL